MLAIAPKDDDASRDFEVTATVRDLDGELVASVRAITHFVRGEKRSLLLRLEDDCIGVECPATETCSSGDCQDAHVDPTTLPTFDPDQVMDPVVVGPPTRDAGAMSLPDSGPPPADGGSDGAVPPEDASFSDASVTSGCTLNPNRENEVCPEICPEACNAKDDDCDLRIDEEEADADCDLAHGTGECNRGECRVVDCDEDFNDCDQDAVTGCESYSKTDEANCGSCEQACDFPNMIAACNDGICEPIGCIEMFDDCDESGDSCETPLNTAEDCGYCGFPCTTLMHATATCALGYCGPDQCIGNYGDCNRAPGDGCEQALDTLEFCGDCDAPCDLAGSLDDCSGGVCVAVSCEVDHDDCDLDTSNGCESLSSAMHCGACNRTCDSSLDHVLDADCGTGSCELTCDVAGGFDDCDADPFTGCESSVRTQERCGGCNTPCAFGHAVASCQTSTCARVRCEDGFGDCDLDGADCEQTLNVATHCGGCDIDCTGTAKPFCAGGSCTSIACTAGMADCNDDGLLCEVNTQTDATHCGACDNACGFTVGTPHASLTCSAGACAATCAVGYEDCNRDYRDGCETALNTLTNCGACGIGCSIPNAMETCASGTCQISVCDPDWDDCNNDNTSCETPLGTTADCGACGAACNLANALSNCGGAPNAHVCEIASCSQSYYANCDLNDATGCEIDTRASTRNCGACNNDCTAETNVLGAQCAESACVVDTCDPAFGDCTGSAGCETTLGTTVHCAACGNDCSQLANTATTSCSSMACAIGTCVTGFASCDGLASTGCETSVFSTASCGGCATANANEPCTNLPNATATSCGDGACHIDTCAPDWVDCDAIVANGCEQQLSVVGPCFPDSNCTKVVQAGRNYFFCRNDVTWPVARSRCQSQLLGDLVRVDAVAENTFLATNLSAPSWIGGTDAVTEGAWRWVENAAQFWMGTAGGGAVNGLFTSWAATEPDSTGNCARIVGAGSWADDSCGTARDFICEVQPDLCPTDPAKTLPGQCGCGNLDTDSDGDGTANCNDGCPNDINKVAPGQCLCGTSDLDTDGDGTANCNDGCPDDPNKLSPGACGCNVGDTDIDRDGTPDCVDPCPYVAGTDVGACAYPYQTSNFDSRAVSFGRVPDVIIDCGDPIIDTTDRVSFINWCGEAPVSEVHQLSDGREVVVIPLASLFIASERVLRVVGDRPVIFAVAGDVLIDGYLDGRAYGSSGGAGSGSGCSAPGGTGGNAPTNMAGSGGGGGGGYGTAGGVGGTGYRLTNPIVGGTAGPTERADGLVPLRGGCGGGFGGYGAQGLPGGAPGVGGGAIQISAAGLLRITSKGGVSASGGGGLGANSAYDGGGGGGSGGALLLEAAAISLEEGSWATANGGGGGGGVASGGSASNPGTDGFPLNDVRAPGGPATSNGGAGGFGAANQTQGNASNGGAGTSMPLSTGGGSGGGGGGGIGRIHIAGQLACSIKGNFSPNFTTACP